VNIFLKIEGRKEGMTGLWFASEFVPRVGEFVQINSDECYVVKSLCLVRRTGEDGGEEVCLLVAPVSPQEWIA
jgi:hypothetical protein